MTPELRICRERMTGEPRRTTVEDCLAFTEMLFRVAMRMTRSRQAAETLTTRTIQDIAGRPRRRSLPTSCLKSRLLTQLRDNFRRGIGRNS